MAGSAAVTADAYAAIKAALEIFKMPALATCDVPGKQTLVQAADQVKTDAAKIGLMCSGAALPADQLQSLAAAVQASCVTFCTACHAMTATAGSTLKDSLVKLAQGLVIACLGLVREMGSGKDLKQQVAVVWDSVAAVSKAPADNKACLFSSLTRVMAVLQDTLREMEELQEEQLERFGTPTTLTATNGISISSSSPQQQPQVEQQPSSSSRPDADSKEAAAGSSCEADLDYEAEKMSSSERQLLDACIQLASASAATVKAFGKALLQGPALAAGSEVLDAWESCCWHSKHLRRAVEDLGAAMYPPQDLEEVASASLAAFEVTELMMDECPDPEALGAEQLSELSQQLKAAHDTVQQLLDQAAEQQPEQEQSAS